MKRLQHYLFLLLVLASSQVFGQLSSKAVFFGGPTYQFASLTQVGSPAPTYSPHYGLGFGMDYILMHSNDQASIGINPNANICFSFSNLYGFDFFTSMPVYMLARLGAGSTPYNEQKIGIGGGIGGSFSYLATPVSSGDMLKTSFINPGALAELQFRYRGGNIVLRFNWSLAKSTQNIELGNNSFAFRMGVSALSIFYNF